MLPKAYTMPEASHATTPFRLSRTVFFLILLFPGLFSLFVLLPSYLAAFWFSLFGSGTRKILCTN